MNCPECGDRLHQWLDGRTRDGAAPGELPALCAACADWAAAARRLDRGLRLLAPPAPPPHLADRIVAGVAAQRRRRRLRVLLWAGAAAAAAAALLVAWPAFHAGSPPPPAPAPVVQGPTPQPPNPAPAETHATLRDSMAEAGSAVSSAVREVSEATVAKTKILIPAVDPALSKFDLPPPLDPPKLTLRETGEGVSAGLEPVTDSARRAVGLFLRELPPMEAAPKGGF